MTPFKAYDIRGRIPDELNEDIAYRIGKAYAAEITPDTVVVGHDVRLESPMLSAALAEGLNDAGVDVIDIGLCGTEEVYFHTFYRQREGVDGGIMVTASHNPKGYNGMKLVSKGARPISGDTGLFAIRDRVYASAAADADDGRQVTGEQEKGKTYLDTEKSAYIDHLLTYVDAVELKPLTIVANPGNGGAGLIMKQLEAYLPFQIIYLNEEPDGDFPNGVPNPLLLDNREATSKAVREHGADLGIAWDGDFDRCFLFDGQGHFIEGYYLVGLLAEVILAKHPGVNIIHDPRLTWNTIEQVQAAGGVPIQSKTGHAFIKERMRQEDAVYGGEMSAHHYFRDFAYCDSGMIPWLMISELMSHTGKKLASLVDARMRAFPCSGEINYCVENAAQVVKRIQEHFQLGAMQIDHTDGLSMEFENWRFNLRASNTEPLLRLNVEAREDANMVKKRVTEIEGLITMEDPQAC